MSAARSESDGPVAVLGTWRGVKISIFQIRPLETGNFTKENRALEMESERYGKGLKEKAQRRWRKRWWGHFGECEETPVGFSLGCYLAIARERLLFSFPSLLCSSLSTITLFCQKGFPSFFFRCFREILGFFGAFTSL